MKKHLALLCTTLFSFSTFAATGIVAHVNLSPTGKFEAKTSQVQGHAVIKAGQVSAQNVKVPLKTLTTGIDLRDKHMKEKYLEVEKYPEAELVRASGKNGKATGLIKIRGIEKEVSGTYEVKGNELEAEFPIKLSEFKITGIRYLGVGVRDDVDVSVNIPLETAK